ncbi:MAG: tetratricopeptide repeat protein [Methanomicrobiales archaeon]|nr:tetratricopeptide repeat protein [Methanomicrobiales archaeon]
MMLHVRRMVKPDSSHQEKGEDSKAYTTFGDLYFSEGQYEDAIQQYVRALEANPDDLEAWNKLHNSLVNLGRADEAQSIASKIQEVKDRSTPPSTGTAPMKALLLFKEILRQKILVTFCPGQYPKKPKATSFCI